MEYIFYIELYKTIIGIDLKSTIIVEYYIFSFTYIYIL